MTERIYDSISSSKNSLKNRLFHMLDLDDIATDEHAKSIESEKKMLTYSEKRKKTAEEIMESWKKL